MFEEKQIKEIKEENNSKKKLLIIIKSERDFAEKNYVVLNVISFALTISDLEKLEEMRDLFHLIW